MSLNKTAENIYLDYESIQSPAASTDKNSVIMHLYNCFIF